ncbi:MAG: hypothetical protein NXY57DRAFT_1041508 [Lentinula lateritia]|nr:MAG: hypothetical protein NXY57DRAFT_1041508 [Lentinula lateritia]
MRLPLPAMICMFILCLFSEWTCAMPLALDTPRIDEIVHAENAAPKFSPTPIPSVAVRDGNSEKLQSFRQWQTEPSIHKRKSSLMSRLEVRFLTQEEIMEDTKLPEGIRKFAQEEFIQYHGNVTSTTTTTAAAKIQEQAKSIIRSHLLWNLPYGENGMLYFGEKKHTRTLIFPDDNSKLQYPFSSIPDSGVAYEIHDRREESLGPCKPRCHGAAWIIKAWRRVLGNKRVGWGAFLDPPSTFAYEQLQEIP